jgi:glyoxylase-like metal-dependent hydrolase (beta-lactamase superfamily II)
MATLGSFQLHSVSDGTLSLDGGAMFGVVPRPLWSRHFTPDSENRITLALRCLLIVSGTRRILVDDGAGTRWDEKRLTMYGIDQRTSSVHSELQRLGYPPQDVTDVILTHLHFDHAGGTTQPDGRLTFPNATYHLQRRHWDWAHAPSDKDRGSFRKDDFEALRGSNRLHLIDGETELFDGVHLFTSEGHTVGLQLVRVSADEKSWVFCGDLIPTTAHLKPAWVAAYDLQPLLVIQEKQRLLAQAVREHWVLFLEHDPNVAACTVKDRAGELVVETVVTV